jgi:uncharacterized protein YegJ (DUF2314 family)
MAIASRDPEYQQTIADAKRTLPEFRRRLGGCEKTDAIPSVKIRLTDGDDVAFIWLTCARVEGDAFVAIVFEIPAEFTHVKVGDRIRVVEADVLDWMINDSGVLHGGFSVRYQRSKIPESERASFDEYVGVSEYA